MVSAVSSTTQLNEQRPRRLCGLSGVTQLVLEAPLETQCQDLQLWVPLGALAHFMPSLSRP